MNPTKIALAIAVTSVIVAVAVAPIVLSEALAEKTIKCSFCEDATHKHKEPPIQLVAGPRKDPQDLQKNLQEKETAAAK
jgi:hypothetical protein